MKRSSINCHIRNALELFEVHRVLLPPFARWTPDDWNVKGPAADEIRRCRLGWDLTDFGRGDFERCGLLLFTIRNGCAVDTGPTKPYAEKVMVVGDGQLTPWHYHVVKMEDIINRGGGRLVIELSRTDGEGRLADDQLEVSVDGLRRTVPARGRVELAPGESITLPPRLAHQFQASGGPVLAGEVSSRNDDEIDNYFIESVSRFPAIEEDEPPLHLLCTEYPTRVRRA